MFTTGSWIRSELLHYLAIPDSLLFIALGGLVLVGLWLITKPISEHKVHRGVVVRSWLDDVSVKLLIVGSVILLVATPLLGVFSKPVVGIPAVVWLVIVINHCLNARPIRGLESTESQLVILLPSIVIVDCVIGMPVFLHGVAVLMTIGSALTAFMLVERELENDKGQGDQSGGVFVAIAKLCQLILRAVAIFSVIAIVQTVARAAGWIASHQIALFIGAVALLLCAITLPLMNVTIPIKRKERKRHVD